MSYSPITLFAYNRPDHVRQTVESLRQNHLAAESDLFVFSDGARGEADAAEVAAVREYIKTITGFKSVTVTERDENFGLPRNITGGVTKIVERFGRVIVMEDDLITSPFFLRYMNDALELYADDEQVMHVSGYLFPIDKSDLPETFFYNQASCWGWGTWTRAWKKFQLDAQALYDDLRSQGKLDYFNIDGTNPGFEEQLKNNISGKKTTWAIKWQAAVTLADGLCLHPNRSLVQNIGLDGSGENSRQSERFAVRIADSPVTVTRQPLFENGLVRARMRGFYKRRDRGFLKRLITAIQKIFVISNER